MNKTIIVTFLALIMISVGAVSAKEANGQPFQELWDSVQEISDRIDSAILELNNRIDTIELTPGPQGETGADGAIGATGPKGDKGDVGPQGSTGSVNAETLNTLIGAICNNAEITESTGAEVTSLCAPKVIFLPRSAAPLIPSGQKLSCSTCAVLEWNGNRYWAYSYTDNRVAVNIVAFNADNQIVKQLYKTGDRYISNFVVDNNLRTVVVWGQYADHYGGPQITINWNELRVT